jgi:hypothetical protein
MLQQCPCLQWREAPIYRVMASLDEAVASDEFVPLNLSFSDAESTPDRSWNLRAPNRVRYWPPGNDGETSFLACTVCGRIWCLSEPIDGDKTPGSFAVCQWGRSHASLIYNEHIRLISEMVHTEPLDPSNFVAKGFYRFLDRGLEPVEQHYRASLHQALFEYSEAIALAPKWPLPHLRMAVAYLALADYQNAVGECDKASNLQPSNPRCREIRDLAVLGNLKQELEDSYRQGEHGVRSQPVPSDLGSLNDRSNMEILYSWDEGSIPPPGYYEYLIRINQGGWNQRSARRWPLGGEGMVTRCPNYSVLSPPTWTRSFTVPQAGLDKLFNTVREIGRLVAGKDGEYPRTVGDTQENVQVEIDGVQFTLRSGVDEHQNRLINSINALTEVGLSPFQKEIEQPPTIGGPQERVEVDINGIQFKLSTGVDERQDRLFSAIRALLTDLVPPECTVELEALHQKYIAERTHIAGSLSGPGDLDTVKAFVFDWWELTLEVDHYEPSNSRGILSEDEKAKIAEDLKEAADFPIEIEQIRIGEFWCVDGHHWVEAIENKWGVGVCLSCSLARGS